MSHSTLSVFADVDFERRRLFETSDLDEVRQLSARVFSPHRISVRGRGQRISSRMEHIPLGSMSLNRLTWGASVEVDPGQLGSYYLVCLPVKGHARFFLDGAETQVSSRLLAIVNPLQRFHFSASEDYAQIVVRLERQSVEAAWQGLTGSDAPQPIRFDNQIALADTAWRALAPALGLIARCTHGAPDALRSRLLNARAEDLLVSALLLHQPHSRAPELLVPPAPRLPANLRRAQAFMAERLETPLALADVAKGCGMSARRLQALFHSHVGVGPMQWIRTQRLHAVRDVLLDGTQARQSVTDTAVRFGFSHLGEFSKAYRQLFDELPSATLSRKGW